MYAEILPLIKAKFHKRIGDIREIRLFDVNNRETLRWNGSARRVSLDISALKPGVYVIRAVSGQKTLTRLVVKR